MFHVTGRISGKKPLKTGVSSKGEWRVIVFSITKRFNKEQIHLWFTARGKAADLVNKLRINDKVDIEFIPKHQNNGEYLNTDNVVREINLSARKSNWDDTNEELEPDIELGDDLNLKKIVDNNSKQYNGKRTKTA